MKFLCFLFGHKWVLWEILVNLRKGNTLERRFCLRCDKTEYRIPDENPCRKWVKRNNYSGLEVNL